jgi:hypothetical protein
MSSDPTKRATVSRRALLQRTHGASLRSSGNLQDTRWQSQPLGPAKDASLAAGLQCAHRRCTARMFRFDSAAQRLEPQRLVQRPERAIVFRAV